MIERPAEIIDDLSQLIASGCDTGNRVLITRYPRFYRLGRLHAMLNDADPTRERLTLFDRPNERLAYNLGWDNHKRGSA